jgi:hypothetical protein
METAWILQYELPDAFGDMMITLRDRAQSMLEMADAASIPSPTDSEASATDEEESAI